MNIPERVIIRYWDGTEAKAGDVALVDETQRAVVLDVIDTPEKMKSWALDEFGLMFDGVFYPESFLREFPIDLVSRPVA
jgi:hypothetical protein